MVAVARDNPGQSAPAPHNHHSMTPHQVARHRIERARQRVLFIGTQFSILYTSMYSPAGAASTPTVPTPLGSLEVRSDFIAARVVTFWAAVEQSTVTIQRRQAILRILHNLQKTPPRRGIKTIHVVRIAAVSAAIAHCRSYSSTSSVQPCAKVAGKTNVSHAKHHSFAAIGGRYSRINTNNAPCRRKCAWHESCISSSAVRARLVRT